MNAFLESLRGLHVNYFTTNLILVKLSQSNIRKSIKPLGGINKVIKLS